MESTIENKNIVITLSGRIDSGNAEKVEKEIGSIIKSNPTLVPAFDAEKLEYISSAGLRVLLRCCKAAGMSLEVRNVSRDVYEIFDTTGFTNILDVQKSLRRISVDGLEVIGQGGNGTVYRLDDDKIVKVYRPWMKREDIDREREFARNAFMNGIPSVIAYDLVRCGDSYGIVFEMIKSKTLGMTIEEDFDNVETYVDKYVQLAKSLHSIHVSPESFPDIRDILRQRVPRLAKWCSKEEMELLDDLIDCIPETDTVIHNDLHPGNIMIQDGELILIDMPEMTRGPVIFDLVGIYRDLISAPSGDAAEHIELSLGMKADKAIKVGNMFFRKYAGINDESKLQEYYRPLGLLFAFNVVLVVGTGSAKAMELAPILMDKLLRGIVIPHQDALRHLLGNAK